MNGVDELLTRLTGIELTRGGLRCSLERHAEHRAQHLGLASVDEYYARVMGGDETEREQLFDVVGVPYTWFFRDLVLLEAACEVLRANARQRRALAIWIPGCATGEDAYSLSMMVQESGCEARITASDISGRSLERARTATYGPHSVRELPAAYAGYLRRSGDTWQVREGIRERVSFQQHNLMDPPLQHPGGWDLILCRNVLIYFSAETSSACADRLASSLHSEGTALFGPGELIQGAPPELFPVMIGQRVAFRRRRSAGSAELPPVVTEPVSLASRTSVASRAPVVSRAPVAPRAPLPPRAPITLPAVMPPRTVALPPASKHGEPSSRVSQRDLTAAAHEVLEASARDPLDPELRMLAGIALYTARDYLASLAELRAALLLDDRLWPAALYQGLCLDSMGAPQRARTEYRHAVRLLESDSAELAPLPAALEGLAGDLLMMARRKALGR